MAKFYSVFVILASLALGCNGQQVGLTENDDQVLISPELKDKPELVYEQLKQYLEKRQGEEFDGFIDGLGKLTVQQVVGACRSLEGDCDITDLGALDEKLYLTSDSEDSADWQQYTSYCRDQWLARCNATDVMIKRIGASFTRDEWMNTRELVDFVLREPSVKKDPKALDIHYRYPEGVVKFMRAKNDKLDEQISHLKKGKRDLFKRRYIETVRPVCEQAVSSLKYAVQGMKWTYNDVIPAEELGASVETALKIFRICLKISAEEEALVHFSYDVFAGKRKGTLMDKLKSKALATLGANK